MSSSSGLYALPGLRPGEYSIAVELSGFRTARQEGIRVETGLTRQLDVSLAVGGVTETVTVTGDASALRATASLGHVVSEEKIPALPLNGRSFITLAQMAPAVALPPGSQLPRINGGRPRTNEYLFDGISVLQPEPGQVAFFPIIDSIQEFKIETNSPPAEFGRFNGGVVNLTTKSGSNALHGAGFEFFRHESLNARNFFASTNPVKPEFRRNQFGGVLGGPLRRDRTFFFVDYQGQRQNIGRTVISTVPTALQRQGIFTEAIGGRVPAIYDPATTVANGSGGFTRTPFANGVIPADRFDSVARDLLSRYPMPTSAGTANNYRRVANEVDDQNQADVRIDHKIGVRDQVFARLSRFQGTFLPVTPLPEGSGSTSGTLGPQDTTSWALASNYQRAFSPNLLNEVRFGDTRRTVGRTAAQLTSSAGSALNIPGIPSYAQFPNTLPTFTFGGAYQQLGSPANTATDFNTSVSEVADTLTWVRGRHTMKAGFDWRWERLNVIQPPSPTGSFAFSTLGSDLPGVANTGAQLASFLLGQVQTFSIDLQTEQIQERAQLPGVLRPGRLAPVEPLHHQPRPALHAEFPLHRDQRADGGVQSRDAAARVPRRRAGAAAQEEQLRPAARAGLPRDRQDAGQHRLRAGVDRDGRHHDPVHHAVVPVPADGHAAGARHHQSRRSCCRTVRAWRRSRRCRRRAWGRGCSAWTPRSARATCSSGTRRCSAS